MLNTIGNGFYLTSIALYLSLVLDRSVLQTGLILSGGGVLALAGGPLVGKIADRSGPRRTYVIVLGCGSAAMVGLALTGSVFLSIGFIGLASVVATAGPAARAPLVNRYGGEQPQRFRAYLRSTTNVGFAVGAGLAGLGLHVGTPTAYQTLILLNGLSFLLSAGLVRLLPADVGRASEPVGSRRRSGAFRDAPYLVLAVIDGILSIQYRVLTIAVPLWVATTGRPYWLVSATLVINTAMVALGQVWVSRGVVDLAAGARCLRRAGFVFLLSCVLFPLSDQLPGSAATVLLLVAAVVHTLGELWHASGAFEVSFRLAPPHRTGEYLGVFGMGAGLAEVAAPTLLSFLCITWGTPGWLLVGGVLAAAGLCATPAVRWAQAAREPAGRVSG
nr:MFS transporter [Cryptosporangium arvum]